MFCLLLRQVKDASPELCFPAGEQGRVGVLAERFCLGTAQVVLKCRTRAKNAELGLYGYT